MRVFYKQLEPNGEVQFIGYTEGMNITSEFPITEEEYNKLLQEIKSKATKPDTTVTEKQK